MKGYAIIDRNNEGKASVGFQKVLSAIQKYEAYKEWADNNAVDALTKTLDGMTPLSLWEKFKWNMRDVKNPPKSLVLRERVGAEYDTWAERLVYTLKDALIKSGALTYDSAWGLCNGNLEFVHQKDEYEALRNIIRNGEQFMIDHDLCKFVNYWNRKDIPR